MHVLMFISILLSLISQNTWILGFHTRIALWGKNMTFWDRSTSGLVKETDLYTCTRRSAVIRAHDYDRRYECMDLFFTKPEVDLSRNFMFFSPQSNARVKTQNPRIGSSHSYVQFPCELEWKIEIENGSIKQYFKRNCPSSLPPLSPIPSPIF